MTKHSVSFTKRRRVKNIFSDRSSLVLRALLREPEKRWTLTDLEKEGVSLGLASDVLSQAEAQGYVERILKGPESHTRLIRKEALLKGWLNAYSFEKNDSTYYLSTDRDFLENCHRYLKQKKIPHALTLYSASRLISPYVKDDRHFVYVDVLREEWPATLKALEIKFNLYRLVHGGNVCLMTPFYRSSCFRDSQTIKGYPVASRLQLYLDLMTFPPTGPEEAGHLISHFKKKGQDFV